MRCLNCFKEIENQDECPYCHHIYSQMKNKPNCLQPGVTLNEGRYIIGKALNAGGFGIVYKAFDTTLEIVVAIKEFFPSSLASRVVGQKEIVLIENNRGISFSESKESFLREARIMELLKGNTHIVSGRDWFEENNTAYIVMEFIEGINIRDFLVQNDNRLDVESTQWIIKQIISALNDIHQKGFVFRDLTPDNIMITTEFDKEGHNIVKLIDFGAAVDMNSTVDTAKDDIILKPGYAPIEQYVSGGVLGAYTDIYALGATAYRMLSGLVPYEVTDRNKQDTLEKLTDLDKTIPEYIDRTIMKAMAIDKKIRFQTVEEFEKAFIHEQSVLYPEEELKKLKRKKKLFFVFLSLICITLAGVGMYIRDKKSTGINNVELITDTITVALPYQKEDDKNYLNEIVDDYQEKHPEIKVEALWIQNDTYKQYLLEQKKLPNVFMNNGYIESEKLASLDELTVSLNENDYYFFDNQLEGFQYFIPLGYDAAVCYVNINQGTVSDICTFEKMNQTVGYEKQYFYQIDESLTQSVGTKNQFLTEQIPYYVGKVTEWEEIYQKMPGYWDVKPFTNEIYVRFSDYVSVSKDSTNNQKNASMLFIYELLSDLAQNNRYIQSDGLLPVNKQTCDLYLELHKEFDFIVKQKGVHIQK